MSLDPAEPPIPEDPEEEIIPYVGPPKLLPVAIKTGEEDFELLMTFKCKLYRFRNEEWKQRGQGILKFLKHQETKKCRILMRQDATYFIRANHLVSETIVKSMFHQFGYEWIGQDHSDGETKLEQFSVKLESEEDFDKFYQQYEECRILNKDED
ncbi:unnamed protein product [Paramecium pentaurelia]|uniref:RanBD1 domain-containing protein n=1 Tax=Paramecium pentaurelia TaxID=43138 RepID=A0A8S1VCW2_9CILI|nr:unnamed protein product [Paramecium pentaurelia]